MQTFTVYDIRLIALYLRNRKHFPWFHTVIETRVEVWENEKLQWYCISTQFRVLPNFHECFYNVWEHRENVFYFFYKIKAFLSKRKFSVPFKMAYAMAWTFSCFPYSYKNTDFSQSKLTFSKCYFIYNFWNKLDLLDFITWMNNKKYIHDCIVVEIHTRSFFPLCDSQINYTT